MGKEFSFTLDLNSLKNVIHGALKATDTIEHAVGRELVLEGERLKNECLPETPYQFGALRLSAFVSPPMEEHGEIFVKVGFGGPSAPYAKIVHDNPNAYHKPPTKYRYLIDPFNRRAKGVLQRVSAGVKANWK